MRRLRRRSSARRWRVHVRFRVRVRSPAEGVVGDWSGVVVEEVL